MSLLAPFYLLAGLAVAGPILFHLLRRTPRGRRMFSTLMFLSPSPPRFTRRSSIEHWLLLLLRAAALLLLAAAFSRPFWRTVIASPDTPKLIPTVAILVDTSASLRRDGLWDQLGTQLSERLKSLDGDARLGLFAFADGWKIVAGFRETDALEGDVRRQLVESRWKDLHPEWSQADLGLGLTQTVGALQEALASQKQPGPVEVWLLSDLADGSKTEALAALEWPDGCRVVLLNATAPAGTNAGLQLVERTPDRPDDKLRVRVSNASDSQRDEFRLRWSTSKTGLEPVTLHVPAGQSRVIVPPPRPDDASELALEGDDAPFDNALWIAEPVRPREVIVYGGTEPADDSEQPRFYLQRALTATAQFDIEFVGLDELGVDRPSLVVLTEPPAAPATWLKSWIAEGGTVLAAPRKAGNVAPLLEAAGVSGVTATEGDVPRYTMLADVDFEHPLLAPFAQARFADFTGIHFWKYRALEFPQNETPRVLARFDAGAPAWVEWSRGKGRVVLWTSGWHPADSQLARSSKFPPLLLRLLELTTGVEPRPLSYVVNQAVPLPAIHGPADIAAMEIRGPNGTSETVAPGATEFVATTEPGLYTVTQGTTSWRFAVNVPPLESRTVPLAPEQLETLGVPLKSNVRDLTEEEIVARQQLMQREEIEQSQQLWRWGLIAAMVFLVGETLLARRSVPGSSADDPQAGLADAQASSGQIA